MVWNVTQSCHCTPSEAWRQLGRPELSPRRLRRLTLASLELAALSQAWDDVTRKRGKGDRPPDSQHILAVRESERMHNEYMQPTWDTIAEECERELAAKGELAEGEHVAPFRGEDSAAVSGGLESDEVTDG